MAIPPRLAPLLDQFEFARERLVARLNGPVMDSGDGSGVPVGPITDAELLWEPVADCWSVRRREDGPGPRATFLTGVGAWGRDAAPYPHPEPAPFTTIAWRLSHLSEMFTLRTDHISGSHRLTRDDFRSHGEAAAAVADFEAASAAWHTMLLSLDDGVLDKIGYSSYPHGSDPEDPLLEVIWWMNQELLHHGAEIALLRDLHRARGAGR